MFLFVLSAATCLCFFFLFFFSIYTSLLVSHTSSRSRGTTTTTKKKYHDVKNAIVDIFVYLVLIYSCWFISLFEFLIYYNLAIYMNKAVRSVECYLLPSCVFVKMGQRLKKKKRTFFFFFLSFCFRSEFNGIMWNINKSWVISSSTREREPLGALGKKKWFTSNLRM